jgi:hypothetical protein
VGVCDPTMLPVVLPRFSRTIDRVVGLPSSSFGVHEHPVYVDLPTSATESVAPYMHKVVDYSIAYRREGERLGLRIQEFLLSSRGDDENNSSHSNISLASHGDIVVTMLLLDDEGRPQLAQCSGVCIGDVLIGISKWIVLSH